MFRHRLLLVPALALIAAGCATVSPPPPVDWNAVAVERQGWDRWGLSGRTAVTAGRQGWNASLDWQQGGAESELRLHGPFGLGALRVNIDGEAVQIHTAKGEVLAGEDARLMLEHTLGVDLPLEHMRYWLLAVPAPKLPAFSQLDAQGRLAQLDQRGWRVTYQEYGYSSAHWLPGRVTAERDGVKIKVVVDRWRLDD